MIGEKEQVEEVVIVWRDPKREAFRVIVDEWNISDGCLSITFPEDLRPTGVNRKEFHYPLDLINAIETFTKDKPVAAGYREESQFRESPTTSPHFRGMGNAPQE